MFICVHKEIIQVEVNILERTRKKRLNLLHYKGIIKMGKKDRGKTQMLRIRLNLFKLYTIGTNAGQELRGNLGRAKACRPYNTFAFKH